MCRKKICPLQTTAWCPDLIINPHAIPSRMTIGQFIESLAGKAASARGKPANGTPFSNEGPTEMRKNLVKLGYSHTGSEVFYNGMTGEKFVADVYVGVVYYQKLHHMVADKIHARARGQVQMLTQHLGIVMPGLVPGIHVFKTSCKKKTWMARHRRA